MSKDRETAQELLEQAARCRRLAGSITDRTTIRRLEDMAADLERRAGEIESGTEMSTSQKVGRHC